MVFSFLLYFLLHDHLRNLFTSMNVEWLKSHFIVEQSGSLSPGWGCWGGGSGRYRCYRCQLRALHCTPLHNCYFTISCWIETKPRNFENYTDGNFVAKVFFFVKVLFWKYVFKYKLKLMENVWKTMITSYITLETWGTTAAE